MGTNPAVSLPNADAVRTALGKLDLFVVSENVLSNDTVNSGAHVLLPAHAWGEKSGTVTNSERRISRQRAFLEAAGESRPDWWIVSEVGKRLGFAEAFAFSRRLTSFASMPRSPASRTSGKRDFDIGGLAQISDDAFDALAPVHWPVRQATTRRSASSRRAVFTPTIARARFVAPDMPRLKTQASVSRPLRLNTGRIRDQWHTMTRTGLSPRLGQHLPEPFVEIHPDDAAEAGIANGGFAEVTTEFGRCMLKVLVSDRQQRGMLFAPIHWNERTASSARVGALVAAFTDPFSGQPEVKATPAAIAPHPYVQRGFVLSRRPLRFPDDVWWTRVAVTGGHGYLLAHNLGPEFWQDWFAANAPCDDVAAYDDRPAAPIARRRLRMVASSSACSAARSMKRSSGMRSRRCSRRTRCRPTSGACCCRAEAATALPASGPIVCACFGVGRNTIADAVSGGAGSVAAIGAH